MSSYQDSLSIPARMREEVASRDGGHCRVCGRLATQVHHIIYGGTEVGVGGRRYHHPLNLVCLCTGCHNLVHSDKGRWQGILLALAKDPTLVGFAVLRWLAQGVTPESIGIPERIELPP